MHGASKRRAARCIGSASCLRCGSIGDAVRNNLSVRDSGAGRRGANRSWSANRPPSRREPRSLCHLLQLVTHSSVEGRGAGRRHRRRRLDAQHPLAASAARGPRPSAPDLRHDRYLHSHARAMRRLKWGKARIAAAQRRRWAHMPRRFTSPLVKTPQFAPPPCRGQGANRRRKPSRCRGSHRQAPRSESRMASACASVRLGKAAVSR